MSIALLELAAAALGELVDEVSAASSAAGDTQAHYAALLPDDASQARAERIVIPRIEAIVGAD